MGRWRPSNRGRISRLSISLQDHPTSDCPEHQPELAQSQSALLARIGESRRDNRYPGDSVEEGASLSRLGMGKPRRNRRQLLVPTAKNINPTIETQESEHTGGSFIEFIVTTEAAKPADQIAEGRRTLASLITMIDLSLGPRVLGVQLTEEIGKIFDDGHFLCSGQSMLVGMESLMTIEPLFMEQLYGWSQFVINRHMGRTDDERTGFSRRSGINSRIPPPTRFWSSFICGS